ncbi:LOW QUALITY PROTEIN: NUT family member 1 [Cricetulus griseus]|uniref:LOW QUALITY PROTEIN: NUT family member 1 n=1 Tax=Cricetulus griseus TaxID=10029 RepID=UPI000F73FD4D|nr:LOW QUALITY PROTEIN: NUT family member 1 [Cricetulus griseus]
MPVSKILILFLPSLYPTFLGDPLLELGYCLVPGPNCFILEASPQPLLVPKPQMMASDRTSPLPGPDMAMKPGAGLPPFTGLPFAPPTPVPPDPPLWEPSPQPPIPPAFSPGSPLLLSAFPSPLLVTGEGGSGPSVAGTGQVIVKVKTEVGPAEPSQSQNLIVTQTALNWITSGAPGGGQEGLPPPYVTTSSMKSTLPAVAVGVSQEGPAGLSVQALPPTAQLAPIVPLEKSWPGTQAANMEGGPVAARKPSQGDLAYASKGVYENYRRWQRYKVLARTHLSQSPDAEALSCFLIPVLRSLARLKPTMTLEEGLPRALQEWERTSNFDRMIFYEMAEKFMEFEVEEEMQIQNTQLMNGSPGLSPVTPLKLDPGPLVPEACQQPVYIPKKAASKSRAPRRRQRKPQRALVPEAPKEIPPEAVQEYIDIMEGLMGSHLDTGKTEEEEGQLEDAGMYPDPSLLSYIDELCSQKVFVSKVEAVIHPQFLADLLSPEEQRDPLALIEELEQEEGLTLAQLVQKRLLALEEEDAQAPPSCSAAQSDSSPSVSDEDEDGGRRPRPSPGLQGASGTVHIGKSASPGKQAREMYGGQEQALGGSRGILKDGNTLPSSSSWDLQLDLAASQGMQVPLGVERKGTGKVIKQLSARNDGHLGGTGSSGHYPVADRNSESLLFCWQEGPPPMRASNLDVALTEPVPLQALRLENQALGVQIGQQIRRVGVLIQGREASAVSQEGSSRAMWRDDRGPAMVQSFDQNHSPGVAGNLDRVSLSPELWLSSDMDAVRIEFPLQIQRVTDSTQDEACIRKDQALSSRNSVSPSSRKTTVPEDMGNTVVPCGGPDVTAILEKSNSCSLPGSLMANGPALRSKENQELSPETIQDPSDLWAEGCSPLLETFDTSTLGSSKDTLIPTCQDNLLILGTQDSLSFPQASQEAESRGNLLFPLLENIEHVNILDVKKDSGPQPGLSNNSCSSNFNSYNLQGEGREGTVSSKPTDLVPLQGNQGSYPLETSKSTSGQGLRSTSPRGGVRGALVLREISSRETHHSADRAKASEREEEEDEELSNFAYLLASKLSLSSGGLSFSTCQASGGQGIQKTSHLSAEVDDLSQPSPLPHTSGRQVLLGGSATAVERPQPGSSGQKPLALGIAQLPQTRKRRRDSFVTSKRKKRRRSQ